MITALGIAGFALLAAAPIGSGVLVMAHGGDKEWNRLVTEAVEPVGRRWPVEIAFGMADSATLAPAVARLESKGARRIAVVRLFVSGASFLERTEYIRGLRKTLSHAEMHMGHRDGHAMETKPLQSQAAFLLSKQGLLDYAGVGPILRDRVAALSKSPAAETVLILGHGPGSDEENALWLAAMEKQAKSVLGLGKFRGVFCRTLREDWPDKREAAEADIRGIVAKANENGGRCLVVPYRLAGFGPYAEVLKGLTYVSDGKGFLPHAAITAWIEEQASRLLSAAPATTR